MLDKIIRLPSGAIVDIDRPNLQACKTSDDFMELKFKLTEKIIEIELQIDMFESGAGVAQGRAYEREWLPKAKAALKWAKLYRDQCQARQGQLSAMEKQAAHATRERLTIDAIRAVLTHDQFHALLEIADALAQDDRVGVAA